MLFSFKSIFAPRYLHILTPFFGSSHEQKAIAIHRPADVRPILKAYSGKDVALEYGKFEADIKRKQLEEWEKSGKKRSAVEGVSISRLFGGVSTSVLFFLFLV